MRSHRSRIGRVEVARRSRGGRAEVARRSRKVAFVTVSHVLSHKLGLSLIGIAVRQVLVSKLG